MNDPTSRQDEGATSHSDDPESAKPRSTLEEIRRRLEEHSPLEDLGPIFGPEAQWGKQP